MKRITISRDDDVWQGHPDVALFNDCLYVVYRESSRHMVQGDTRICLAKLDMDLRVISITTLAHSHDRLNCPRISVIGDKLWIVCDLVKPGSGYLSAENDRNLTSVFLLSSSNGTEWEETKTNVRGIVPDRLQMFRSKVFNSKWFIATHVKEAFDETVDYFDKISGRLVQKIWHCDSISGDWEESVIAEADCLNFCEASIISGSDKGLLCLMRENSGDGLGSFWCKSDNLTKWSRPSQTRLFGCHRPTAGVLRSGNILVTYREQSSIMSPRCWARNTFAAIIPTSDWFSDHDALNNEAIILPLDHDRSKKPDGGYTGWTELNDGRIFVVNYITDDAPKPYICGYELREEDIWSC